MALNKRKENSDVPDWLLNELADARVLSDEELEEFAGLKSSTTPC